MNYFFSTGTARGGTNLLTRSLSVSNEMCFANDPYLPLFKFLRSAIIKDKLDIDLDPGHPLEDYYYKKEFRAFVDAVYEATLDIAFDQKDREKLIELILTRASVSCPAIVPHMDNLRGYSYRDLFIKALDIIAEAYSAKDVKWAGLNENWAIESFPAIARSFPQAQFMIIVRDPRASICSALKQKDKTKMIQVLSFARGWRKNIAFTQKFLTDDLFKNRLTVMRYEDFVKDPKGYLNHICKVLDVSYTDKMLDPKNYRDGAGNFWKGNSYVHDKRPPGIYLDSIQKWQGTLDKNIIEAIESVAGLELRLCGYDLFCYKGGKLSPGAEKFFLENSRVVSSWKSSDASVEEEMAYELRRRELANDSTGCPIEDKRAYFIFEEAFRDISQGRIKSFALL